MVETVACPTCRRPLRVPDTLLGQLVKCPSCEQTFTAHDDLEPAPRPGSDRFRQVEELETVEDVTDIRRRRKKAEPPGKATAVAVMTLVGGILAVLFSLAKMPFCFFLIWPGTYFGLVSGILCIVKGAQLLGPDGRFSGPPTATAILQIINLVNLDLINGTLGILNLVFVHDEELRRYYRK